MSMRNIPVARHGALWVPTLTVVTNIAALTLLNAIRTIDGDVVQCFVGATVDPTAGTAWEFRCSLPFPVDVVAVSDVMGVCGQATVVGAGTVIGDTTNNAALIGGLHDDSAENVYAVFAYKIPA